MLIVLICEQRILEERKHHDDEFYNTYFQSDNMLSKQLKQSEGGKLSLLERNIRVDCSLSLVIFSI